MSDQASTQSADNSAADDLFTGRLPIQEALWKLRLRLLDLTRRNRFLNFKHSPGKSLQFVNAKMQRSFDRLMEGVEKKIVLLPVPDPPRDKWENIAGRYIKPEAKDYARTLGIDTSFELSGSELAGDNANELRALLYPEDLERYCRKFQREMKSALEETGAHTLFLVFGFLECPEKSSSDTTMMAPLISVPVSIERGHLDKATRRYRYHLSYTDDEVAENLCLKEKLRQEHGFQLPDLVENEIVLGDYFKQLQQSIQGKNGWKLRRQLSLTLLSFTKMLLVRDIDPSEWPAHANGESELTEHPIVRMVFEGAGVAERIDVGPEHDEVYDLDVQPHTDIPLIYDADSSQQSALVDALSGRNMVIEGPPGTGKSQTITNLIAAAIADGKTVLFLSEKMAALEVVQKRLALAGLDDFCLELHSNKTHKKQVLEAIQTRRNKRFTFPIALRPQLKALEEKRMRLRGYADLINSVIGNAQGLSVHSLLWRAERFRQGSGEAWRANPQIMISDAHDLTRAEFDSLRNTLGYVCQQYRQVGTYSQDHPFWGFFPTDLMPGTQSKIEQLMRDVLPQLQALQSLTEKAAVDFGGESLLHNSEAAQIFIAALAPLRPIDTYPSMSRAVLPKLFSTADPLAEEAEVTIRNFDKKIARVAKLQAQVAGRLKAPEALNSKDGEAAKALKQVLTDLGLTGLTGESLETLGREVQRLILNTQRALEVINECGVIVGIEFDGSDAQLKKICTLVECAILGPAHLLRYRHKGLAIPNVDAVIGRAHEVLKDVRSSRDQLSERLYLDMVPSESELARAILVLRGGDAWYRVFQSCWRQACRVHRALDKTKVRMTGSQRLQDLEALLRLKKDEARWNANQDYKDVLGPMYQGEDTSFENATELVAWIASTGRRLAEADITEINFDPIEIPEARLIKMAGCYPRLPQSISVLNCARDFLQRQFQDSEVFQESANEIANDEKLVTFLQRIGPLLRDAADKLLGWSPEKLVVEESLQAVTSWVALPEAIQSVDNDVHTRMLLGNEFNSTTTNTDPVWDALDFGRKIIKLELPVGMTTSLLSDEVDGNFEKIVNYLTSIQASWNSVNGFTVEMAKHGRFDLACWASSGPGSVEFPSRLIVRNKRAMASMDMLLPWVQYLQQAALARERGLGDFISWLESGNILPEHLPNVFGYRFYSSIISNIFSDSRPLKQFAGPIHLTVREEFAKLDRDIIKLRGQECAHNAAEKVVIPNGSNGARLDDKTESSLLNYLIPQSRPRMSIRKMMSRAGRSIQAYKPCFMMGPHAVAQFLEPGKVTFDIVVMDEASQLKPEIAIGGIARGKQLIVVGDPKQLPPTSFFDRVNLAADEDDDDGQQAAALLSPSILDVCMGHFRPMRTLRWHYRSRHESLISFSNHHFYKNLIIFPSPYPRGKVLGVFYHHIKDGLYKDQVNAIEAGCVTDAIIDHMINHQDASLGVVTLNLKQRDLIWELLEQRSRNLPRVEAYRNQWEREGMGFFVKNLENVQGDERDVIFVSATFGKPPGASVVRQNFGPISRPDGWRRLNVLFTRARNAIKVFTSMSPEDVVVDSNTPAGTKTLRDYLEYARSGILTDITSTGGQPESDFEVSVADVLRSHGFEVEPQLGVAGYRIDMAVKHPRYLSGYLAAIECDGASYHSGVSVRDRDRIRQEILESLGWKNRIWRIWSTDWFRDPMRETAKLVSFLNDLSAKPLEGAYFVQPDGMSPNSGADSMSDSSPIDYDLDPLSIKVEDDELTVQVGDKCSYFSEILPGCVVTVQITASQNNPRAGIISMANPLAQALLGTRVGGKVTVRDEQGSNIYIVERIIKPNAM